MRGWQTGLAGPNKDHYLELSGSRKPPSSSRSSGMPKDGGGGYSFFVRNEARQAKNGAFSVFVGAK